MTINRQSIEQLPDPSARLTLSVENLTFIRLLQQQAQECEQLGFKNNFSFDYIS